MAERDGNDDARGRLGPEQLDLLAAGIETLPTLPGVAARLLETGVLGEGDPGEELDLIRYDPALTASVLVRANRMRPGSAATVREAAEILGPAELRAAALSAGACEPHETEQRSAAWRCALATACAAELIRPYVRPAGEPELAFTAGLLHAVGEMALRQVVPKAFARAEEAAELHDENPGEALRRVLGTDGAHFALRLGRAWRLPDALRDALWLQGQSPEIIDAAAHDAALARTVLLARAVAHESGWRHAEPDPGARAADERVNPSGIDPERLQEALADLPGRVHSLAERLGLDEPPDDARYRRALASANARLASGDGKPPRATPTDLARRVAERIRPDATLPAVIAELARTADEAAGGAAAAYALSGDGESVLCCRAGTDGERWHTAGVRTDRAASDRPGPAGAAMAAMLTEPGAMAAHLPPAANMHVPLHSGGAWVGGLFLPESATAAVRGGLPVLAALLGLARERARTATLGERLATAARSLGGSRDAWAEARTVATAEAMASGAAHELNNPLAVISGRAQLMRERAASDEDRQVWSIIADQAQRISDVITELMSYASPPPPRPGSFDAGEWARQAVRAFSESDHPQASAVQVDIEVDDRVPPVRADRRQLLDVLRELLANAAAASARSLKVAAAYDEFHDAVLVRVTDDGAGMDEATAGQAFTPFFSAQRAGRRLGMGLSLARRQVELSGGRIWLRSRPGEGTTVYLRLPATGQETEPERRDVRHEAPDGPGGG